MDRVSNIDNEDKKDYDDIKMSLKEDKANEMGHD